MRQIKYIAIHCTASGQKLTLSQLLAEFRAKGWSKPGYHYVVFPDGRVEQLLREEEVANGVKGYNAVSVHIAYIGGIAKDAKGKLVAIDNRTDAQKQSLRTLVQNLKKKYPSATVQGHRDFSPDKNKNGIIDPWERIKECPCFDAKIEYAHE